MMSIATKTRSIRSVQYRAFDELSDEIRQALNYSNIGFSARDILYLHSLYVTKAKTSAEIVNMINAKDAYHTLLGPFGRRLV